MQREFNISLSQEFYSDVVYISQYDADYNIVFHVKNKYAAASVAGLTAKFTGIRPDGLGFEFASTCVSSDVTFAIDNTLSAVAGTGTGEIVFTDANDMVFGSANVQIIVEPAAHPNDTIDADVEEEQALADEIRGMIDDVEDTVTTVTEAKNTAVAAAGNAEDAKDAAVNAKNDAQTAKTGAETAKTAADADALKAEGYALGKQNGTAVSSGSPYYHNNAAYFADQAGDSATSASGSATAAAANTAPTYSSSATYAVGDYCVYNSQLYKCTTAITTAEAWTAAHWTAVTVGDEISALKEDLSYLPVRYFCESGNVYGTGIESDDSTKMRTSEIDCTRTKQFLMHRASGIVINACIAHRASGWSALYPSVDGNLITISDDSVIGLRVVFRRSDSGTITDDQIAGTYIDAYTELYADTKNANENATVLKARDEWSITRYEFTSGYADIRNTIVADDTKCVSGIINSEKIKRFKLVRNNDIVIYGIIAFNGTAWQDAQYQVDTDDVITINSIYTQIRINLRKSNNSTITSEDMSSMYVLPYIDANARIDELDKKIDSEHDVVDLKIKNDGYASRYVHTLRRSGTGKKPVWTIVDDDGRKEAIDVWLPIMQSKNIPITIPVITSKIGVDANYLTWEQVKTLSDAGAEICSHTNTHPDLTALSESDLRTEFSTSKGTLLLHGYNNPYLVYPQNKHSELVRRIASEYFDCGVGYETTAENNIPPIKTYRLTRREIGNQQTLAECKALIDNIVANNGWLITMSHSQSAYMLHPEIIEEMIDYALASGVTICTIRDALNIYANVVEVGDVTELNYTGIDADGMPFGRLNQLYVGGPPSNFDGNNIFDCFQRKTSAMLTITSAQGSVYGYPEGNKGGVLEVTIFGGNYYSYMKFMPLGTMKTYRREYNNGWGEWSDVT